MDLLSLKTVTTLSDCVTIAEQDQVKIVRVIHDKASAAISLHGGHVLSFQPKGQADLLWMSSQAIYDGKAALRGGIPVCWPWFGRIAAPAHGFARNQEWKLIEHRENEQGVIVTLGLQATPESLAIWPYQFDVRLHVEIRESLTVTLDVTNTDSKAWTFSGLCTLICTWVIFVKRKPQVWERSILIAYKTVVYVLSTVCSLSLTR